MNLETVLIEITAGMIVLPWSVFVTANIFSLRQQVALLKAEIDVLKRIEEILSLRIKP